MLTGHMDLSLSKRLNDGSLLQRNLKLTDIQSKAFMQVECTPSSRMKSKTIDMKYIYTCIRCASFLLFTSGYDQEEKQTLVQIDDYPLHFIIFFV
jgi:hypothetical protein